MDIELSTEDLAFREEVRAFFDNMMAGRGGGGPGGAGGQDFIANMFASWDTQPEGGDGMITEEEWDARPQRGGGAGRGGGRFGGGPPQ